MFCMPLLSVPSEGDAHRWLHDVLLLLCRLAHNLEGRSAIFKNVNRCYDYLVKSCSSKIAESVFAKEILFNADVQDKAYSVSTCLWFTLFHYFCCPFTFLLSITSNTFPIVEVWKEKYITAFYTLTAEFMARTELIFWPQFQQFFLSISQFSF